MEPRDLTPNTHVDTSLLSENIRDAAFRAGAAFALGSLSAIARRTIAHGIENVPDQIKQALVRCGAPERGATEISDAVKATLENLVAVARAEGAAIQTMNIENLLRDMPIEQLDADAHRLSGLPRELLKHICEGPLPTGWVDAATPPEDGARDAP